MQPSSWKPNRRDVLRVGALGAVGAAAGSMLPIAASAAPGGPVDAPGPSGAGVFAELAAPTTAGMEYVSFAGIDFTPASSTYAYSSASGQLSTTNGSAFTVPLIVPAGSTVTELVIYYTKSTASGMQVRLVRESAHDDASHFNAVTNNTTNSAPTGPNVQTMNVAVSNLVIDNSASSYFVIVNMPASGTDLWGIRIGYRTPKGPHSAFVPVSPGRVYDSRWAIFGAAPISSGQSRVVSVKDRRRLSPDDGAVDVADFVPSGASAIAYNVTVTQTQARGYLFAGPGDAAAISSSTINWSQDGLSLANGSTVSLDSSRRVKVFAGGIGSTHFIIDVVGYYVPIYASI